MPREPRRFVVSGNYGELSCDPETGAVLSYAPDGEPEYADIARVHLEEFRDWWRERYGFAPPDACDIVDIAFWTTEGTYVVPSWDHRRSAIHGVHHV
jgi:hypothetical protein